jgi:hypothetical protein
MKKLFSSLLAGLLCVQLQAQIKLNGDYALYHFYDQEQFVTTMHVTPVQGNNFQISGEGWYGEGELIGNSGYYDWTFSDGRKGRTNFIVNSKGEIIGHVLGAMPNPRDFGLNWSYVALPGKSKEKPKA